MSAIAGSSLQKQSLSPGKTANPDYVEAHFSATNQSARCSINWWSATTPRSSSAAGWNTAYAPAAVSVCQQTGCDEQGAGHRLPHHRHPSDSYRRPHARYSSRRCHHLYPALWFSTELECAFDVQGCTNGTEWTIQGSNGPSTADTPGTPTSALTKFAATFQDLPGSDTTGNGVYTDSGSAIWYRFKIKTLANGDVPVVIVRRS